MRFFYVIPPLAHLNLMDLTGHKAVYCLAHFCLDTINPRAQEYIDFFRKKVQEGYHVTLDNGAAENSLVTSNTLIDLCKLIKPTEVIAPDVLYDHEQTIETTEQFIAHVRYEEFENIQIFGCPQGNSPETFLKCYLEMLHNPSIATIGLSKLAIPKSFCKITDSHSVSVNRRYVIRLLNELDLLRKPVHLLGMRNITEFTAYRNIPMIRSTDSCHTILAAKRGIILNHKKVFNNVDETPHEYFKEELTDEQIEIAKHNVEEMKKAIQ